jgi:membrane-bound metal-dependent hydrolase YbcI (DUF457 family)
MANYPTHVSTSIALGAAYGGVCHFQYGVPASSAMLSAGLCAIGGVLPDIDSDNAIVLRESLGLVAAVTPLLTLHRLTQISLPQETIVLIAAGMYLTIRFVLGMMLKRWTVHRGMWHSLPAAAIAGGVVFYLCASPDTGIRLIKTGAMTLGYVWHLLLDEIYAVEPRFARLRFKKSFGTALKLWGPNPLANGFVYLLLIGMTFMVNHDWKVVHDAYHYVHRDSHRPVLDEASSPPRPRYLPALPR